MRIKYSDQALKFLTKLRKQDAKRIVSKIEQYAEDPTALQNQVKKLTNSIYFRLRVGNYRVIFSETGEVMKIEKIGNRGDIYRGV
ncbi:MAG: type II toxin-antitoxin system RelE/ParE family toxin [Alphaproteobacteria bacterium]|nr:type II toxin-antitoxin system RelE/ParE family toxin [Alphaproteobacteria bacterium]